MRIALVVAILLLNCKIGICVESQPPSPSIAKTDTHQIKNTNHPQYTTAGLPQTTSEIRPTTSVLAKPEAQTTKDQKTDQSLSDWCLVILTAVLAFATYRLVVQTRRLVDETSIASKRQAAETQTALNISKQAADAAQKSAEVAENALTLIERPYVFAFGVKKFHLSPENLMESVAYEVANFGKTPAIIKRVQAAIENIESNLNSVLQVDMTHNLVIAPILGSGEVRKGLEENIPANMLNFKIGDGTVIPEMKHGDDLFFRIIIHYRGPFTEGHESGFCWRYNTHTYYFEPYGHEKYNYTK